MGDIKWSALYPDYTERMRQIAMQCNMHMMFGELFGDNFLNQWSLQ